MLKPVSIFISYSHQDSSFLEELQKFLITDVRRKKISVWTDDNILAGKQWDKVIKENLDRSEIIIFLVSQNFIASEYINKKEIKPALQNDKMIIIPVLIGAIQLEKFELKSYQLLPKGAKPVDEWEPQNKAWVNVVDALDKVINDLNGNTVIDDEDEKITDNKNSFSKTFQRVNYTDKIFMSLLVFLLFGCIIVFGYGLIKESKFHIFMAMLGIGISLAGYLLGKKSVAF